MYALYVVYRGFKYNVSQNDTPKTQFFCKIFIKISKITDSFFRNVL